MGVLVLTFISILLATFLLVIVMTRQSPEEKIVGERMASIHISSKREGITLEATQLLKATKTSSWLDRILLRFRFAKALQARILQPKGEGYVGGFLMTSRGLFMAG